MNKSSRSISLIVNLLADLESNPAPTELESLALLDELRRLQHKWDEQVAAHSPRRIKSDYATLQSWYRRWLKATAPLIASHLTPALADARQQTERIIQQIESRWWGDEADRDKP